MSSTGRLKASDLPLAVPVVTIVCPRRLSSNTSAWCDQSASMPAAPSASATAGCSSAGSPVGTPRRGSSRETATTWSSSAVSSSESQRYEVRVELTSSY